MVFNVYMIVTFNHLKASNISATLVSPEASIVIHGNSSKLLDRSISRQISKRITAMVHSEFLYNFSGLVLLNVPNWMI